jgi:hypothetical protein
MDERITTDDGALMDETMPALCVRTEARARPPR